MEKQAEKSQKYIDEDIQVSHGVAFAIALLEAWRGSDKQKGDE